MRIPIFKDGDIFSGILIGLCKNASTGPPCGIDPPLRAELFSTGQMKQHGKFLSYKHRVKMGARHCQLLTRLAENEDLLVAAHQMLTQPNVSGRKRVPAEDWFLDNFYLIKENIQTARRHFPQSYDSRLPHLTHGVSAGLPRVYDLAFEAIAHGDGRFDLDSLKTLVSAYQSVTPLQLGELWAIPIMLRLALLENIRRVAANLGANHIARGLADNWADKMMADIARPSPNLILTIADMARSNPPMISSFVATLSSRLQNQNSALMLLFTWLEQWLSEAGESVAQMVSDELQQQAADQVSISNSIDGLRCLGNIDWHEFVEGASLVELVLRQDPSGVYARMDFETRDKYRHAVENLAYRSRHCPEEKVAREALRMAQTAAAAGGAADVAHVGYYLVDAGLAQLKVNIGLHLSPVEKLKKIGRRFALPLYLGSIFGVMVCCALYFVAVAYGSGLQDWKLAVIGVLALLGMSNLAVAIVNCPVMLLIAPRTLPRMDFSAGIPRDYRSLVVVPTILISKEGIESLANSLEVAFLANRDDHLHFGLLTDFGDAATATRPGDVALLQFARGKIENLNRKYRHPEHDPFFLFHRPRLWNPREGVWMGRERKRGKLADLNGLLRGRADGSFELVVGDTAILGEIKYVITLDTDTLLPRESARKFTAAMAHPLNRPRYDAGKRRVIGGYGVMQPRVTMSLSGMNRSLYARMYTNEWGIDPYTRLVSDVYQDLFDEGSFIGKGIYDVDMFERVLGARFPDNRILSHDLVEGCYIRSGLLSDVPLYEEYPASYHDDVMRRRRWIRGDWQVAHWVLPRVPEADGKLHANPLSMLSRWKLTDNLLRSLAAPALFFLLFFGWATLPAFGLWTAGLFLIVLAPSLLIVSLNIFQKSAEITCGQHFGNIAGAMFRRVFLSIFAFMCLPYEALYCIDSIVNAGWRLSFSHRKLLEWKSSDCQNGRSRGTMLDSLRIMWFIPCVAVIAAIMFAYFRPGLLAAARPMLLLWLATPFIIWWLNRPIIAEKQLLTPEESRFLRRVARKTWAFFNDFIGPDDHYLPPDNVQEYPVEVVAHRTSPTNIGLALLANLAAYDFGTISGGRLAEHTADTLGTMEKLERYNGHFYNWYDTRSLKPMAPFYISTVDSGNLCGHLAVLRIGLLELPDRKIIDRRCFESLADTVGILLEVTADAGLQTPDALLHLDEPLRLDGDGDTLTLTDCRQRLKTFSDSLSALQAESEKTGWALDATVCYWLSALIAQAADASYQLKLLTPWLEPSGCRAMLTDFPLLDQIPTLRELTGLPAVAAPSGLPGGLRHFLKLASSRATARIDALNAMSVQCESLARMDYRFLYDESRHLLSIGFNVGESRLDANYYDLLASESRLATFVAIARGHLPQKSWFALGRLLTIVDGQPILLSWSGSMFEYLMPLLVMPGYQHTLIADSCRAAVNIQIAYGNKRRVPWGISECCYNAVDSLKNYQYRAFGVPGLGLKRGLAEDLVIAPYASMLALMIAPRAAGENLQRLAGEKLAGRYGFYEAADYTPAHLPRGQMMAVVKSFMVHHQGMGLLALDSVLMNQPMQRRFAADPAFRATLMLLQERVPKATAFYAFTTEIPELRPDAEEELLPLRIFRKTDTATPAVQLLSNGRYHVMVNNTGSGYSHWNELAVTRWHEDPVCDARGTFCYIRDVNSGHVWSTTYQPVCATPDRFETVFSDGRAEFSRTDRHCETHTEIAVSPEDDVELRRIRITNRGSAILMLDVTSYAEVVLAAPATDASHPAFSNLFVETEIVKPLSAILCSRRRRDKNEAIPWMFHLMASHGGKAGEVSCETDRLHFIGRGHTVSNPVAVFGRDGEYSGRLGGHDGAVLDPIVSIRSVITLIPGETATINLVSGMAKSREDALHLVGKYREKHLADRVFELAWTHEQVLLRQLNSSGADAQLYMRLAGLILYADASLRARPEVIMKNKRGQSGLWGHAISGDRPIVLLKIGDPANIELARQLVQAHTYWRLKGLAVDMVIWNEDAAGYRQVLDDQIAGLIASRSETNVAESPGGIFLRNNALISEADRTLIQTCARAILSDRRGTLADQIGGRGVRNPEMPPLHVVSSRLPPPSPPPFPRETLQFDNGLGGFSPDGREYVITAASGRATPAPWINVLANPAFGTMISESGQSCTWSENAHEFRLTPWENDPVSDTGGEAFYLRDEESGHFWSPMPFPCGAGGVEHTIRHGFGYSSFAATAGDIHSEVTVFVAIDAAVKFTVLKIRNESDQVRHLSLTGYAELVLGDLAAKNAMHVVTEIDRATGAIFARNRFQAEFHRLIAFFDAGSPDRSISCDRLEFLGRNGNLRSPAAMTRAKLSGRVGAALDPCFAIRVNFELEPGGEREIIFRLGTGSELDDARSTIRRFRAHDAPRLALEAVKLQWANTLGAVRVETPDAGLNLLANGWLLYQTISCRLWARCAKYQSGGAFGFRDQLQDVLALIHTRPELVREHLLLAAAHQFQEGDVMHWWHPPLGRGVRTHCSDDYLWLPYAVCRFVSATGDTGVLDEKVPFIKGRPVKPEEESYYDLPSRSKESAGLYQHCQRSIRRGLKFGVHGLPLMGSGDWNDGMNLVGEHGRGESIWLGFFLLGVLEKFAVLASRQGDAGFAAECGREAAKLRLNLEHGGWDGEWYRRAYFDDGSPLGSAVNPECRIDSITQSWSVLSGGGAPDRAVRAMAAVDRQLVRRQDRVIQLLTPPFDQSALEPGYIKGYVPGVRENGGQYTHAAIWAAMAFAKLGDADRAWDLFQIINPINHARSPEEVMIYKVEPYVTAADVYAVPPHTGRGGWTWYSGAAGWMYQLILESLLGLMLEVDRLWIKPCLPAGWDGFKLNYRYRKTWYRIHVSRLDHAREIGVSVDGVEQPEPFIPLINDCLNHDVEVGNKPGVKEKSADADGADNGWR